MKIVNRKEFLNIEKPVLYRVVDKEFYNENCGCLKLGEPYIKNINFSDDWCYYSLMYDVKIKDEQSPFDYEEYYDMLNIIKKENPELELDDVGERDGLYEFEDKYLIYENDDINEIIARLKETMEGDK